MSRIVKSKNFISEVKKYIPYLLLTIAITSLISNILVPFNDEIFMKLNHSNRKFVKECLKEEVERGDIRSLLGIKKVGFRHGFLNSYIVVYHYFGITEIINYYEGVPRKLNELSSYINSEGYRLDYVAPILVFVSIIGIVIISKYMKKHPLEFKDEKKQAIIIIIMIIIITMQIVNTLTR